MLKLTILLFTKTNVAHKPIKITTSNFTHTSKTVVPNRKKMAPEDYTGLYLIIGSKDLILSRPLFKKKGENHFPSKKLYNFKDTVSNQ